MKIINMDKIILSGEKYNEILAYLDFANFTNIPVILNEAIISIDDDINIYFNVVDERFVLFKLLNNKNFEEYFTFKLNRNTGVRIFIDVHPDLKNKFYMMEAGLIPTSNITRLNKNKPMLADVDERMFDNYNTLKKETMIDITIMYAILMNYIANLPSKTVKKEKSQSIKKQIKVQGHSSKDTIKTVNLSNKIIIITNKEVEVFKEKRIIERRTESWKVIGHPRRLKSGKVIWIKPYSKGNGKKTNKIYKIK